MEMLSQTIGTCNVHTGRHQSFGTLSWNTAIDGKDCPLCKIDAIENGEVPKHKRVRSLNIL